MKWNKWTDKWISLPRGQRRATIVLLIIAGVLCIAQLIVSYRQQTSQEASTDYTLLEDEIRIFRSQLDTIPPEERRPTYVRRTHARNDSTYSSMQDNRKKSTPKAKQQPQQIESVPRIDEDTKQ